MSYVAIYRDEFANFIEDPCLHIRLHVRYPLFLSDSKETLIFLTDFREVLKSQDHGGTAVPSCSYSKAVYKLV